MASSIGLPTRLIIVAGTYDGVLAGWDTVKHDKKPTTKPRNDDDDDDINDDSDNDQDSTDHRLHMSFAMSTHEGSVRSLCITNAPPSQTTTTPSSNQKKEQQTPPTPGMLVSTGFDEALHIFDLKHHKETGEFKTPADLGTPTCSAFAPPSNTAMNHVATHCLVGLSSGKIALYKKSDWSVVHILSGHPCPPNGGSNHGGVTCIACHPSGKMALSGGRDGTVRLWDLMRGRLAFVHRITPPSTSSSSSDAETTTTTTTKRKKRAVPVTINCICWSDDGSRFAFCHGNKVTARDTLTGENVLDIELPPKSKPNGICFVGGEEGLFLACACDDGSLPLLGVGVLEGDGGDKIRAVMAIEGVDRVAGFGDDRYKCLEYVRGGSGFLVATANSGGVVSVIDLEGAARIMLANDDADDDDDASDNQNGDADDDDDSDDEDMDVAAEILTSVKIGSGARITDIAVWSYDVPTTNDDDDISDLDEPTKVSEEEEVEEPPVETNDKKRKLVTVSGGTGGGSNRNDIQLDEEAMAKARKLVKKAKKRQKKKKKQELEK